MIVAFEYCIIKNFGLDFEVVKGLQLASIEEIFYSQNLPQRMRILQGIAALSFQGLPGGWASRASKKEKKVFLLR